MGSVHQAQTTYHDTCDFCYGQRERSFGTWTVISVRTKGIRRRIELLTCCICRMPCVFSFEEEPKAGDLDSAVGSPRPCWIISIQCQDIILTAR